MAAESGHGARSPLPIARYPDRVDDEQFTEAEGGIVYELTLSSITNIEADWAYCMAKNLVFLAHASDTSDLELRIACIKALANLYSIN